MFRAMKLRQKEVINITDARRLGFVHDVEINQNDGSLEAIIVPRRRLFGRIFGGEYIIPWDCIEVSGKDVVLVRLYEGMSVKDKE